MFAYTFKQIKIACILLMLLIGITGLIYPMLVTSVAQLFFNWQANGSLIANNGKITGSLLIGQAFTDSGYFWGRPSATTPYPYNPLYSSGSNLAASNPVLLMAIQERITSLRNADKNNQKLIPVDLVTASASGIDPEISPLAAYYQVHRIAVARKWQDAEIVSLIEKIAKHSACNILGEPRINVLKLNLGLDHLHTQAKK